MCGVPQGDSDQSTVLSLSSPLAESARQTCCWSSARRLTLKRPAAAICGQLVDVCVTLKVTKAGSMDSEAKVPTIIPFRAPVTGSVEQTAATPVGRWRMTAR